MFWDNFTRMCNERGQSPTQTAVDLGFSSAMPTKWKEGGIPRRARFGDRVNQSLIIHPNK